MKKILSKKEVREKIDNFFSQKKELENKNVRKIKRLAMKYNIKLGKYRKLFCKKCFGDLRSARTRLKNGFRNVECKKCGARARWKINSS